jgi:WD repeat-containing protein 68
VDTTCTVWDLNTGLAKTQLIAHDREVFDVAFTCNSMDLFASVGADGSVRLFDLRALEHSTILYECATNAAASPNPGLQRSGSQAGESTTSPLLRLAACPRDANLLATFHAASSVVQVLDIRHPGQPLSTLDAHGGHLNALAWQPCSRHLLATCADDAQVLVWDLNKAAGAAETQPLGQKESGVGGSTAGALHTTRLTEPSLVWQGESEVNNLSWLDDGSRLAVSYGRTVQTIKM